MSVKLFLPILLYIFFYFSLWLRSFLSWHSTFILFSRLQSVSFFFLARCGAFAFFPISETRHSPSLSMAFRGSQTTTKIPYRIVGSDTMTRAGGKRGKSIRSRKENAWKTWIPSQDMRTQRLFHLRPVSELWTAKGKSMLKCAVS